MLNVLDYFFFCILVISTAWMFNGTTVLVSLAVLVTGVGIFVSVRCVIRRRGRGSMTIRKPVQVPEISTSSSSLMPFVGTPVSPRRRRALRPGKEESIELFAVRTLD